MLLNASQCYTMIYKCYKMLSDVPAAAASYAAATSSWGVAQPLAVAAVAAEDPAEKAALVTRIKELQRGRNSKIYGKRYSKYVYKYIAKDIKRF